MQAWTHSVNTYDKNKATSEFYKYCVYIIRQQYSRYASRTTIEKTGKSVKHVSLEDYIQERTISDKEGGCSLLDALEDETAIETFKNAELKIDMKNNLEKLKYSMPDVYNYIIGYFFQNKTYSAIAKEYNVNTVTVQRGVRKGLKQLRYYFEVQNKMSL
jgi:RNA polymerase sigma factor (sigma-70 family)